METPERVIYDGHNMVLDLAVEVMVEALVYGNALNNVGFALTNQTPRAGLRTIPGGVTLAAASAEIVKDANGFRTIGTWRATLTPGSTVVYDTLFLLNNNLRPFAALGNFGTITLTAGMPMSVRWSIILRD